MTQKTMQVEVLIYKDVRGKELSYLRITNERKEEVLINVGDKTYKAVQELIEEPKKPEPNRIENGVQTNTPQTQEELKLKADAARANR